MGCSSSSTFEDVVNKPEFRQSMLQFQALHLTRNDVKRLYKVFTTMDIDRSGSITLAELLAHIDLPRTAYTEKIFSIFDDDNSGEIDFREFVLAVWNYCTLSKVNLGECAKTWYCYGSLNLLNCMYFIFIDMFAFDLYDSDGSGELSIPEIMKLLQDIFGKNEMKTNVHARR